MFCHVLIVINLEVYVMEGVDDVAPLPLLSRSVFELHQRVIDTSWEKFCEIECFAGGTPSTDNDPSC
jgi:hypothetical protein